MTAAEYWARGYSYEDYLQLSQWERFKDFRKGLKCDFKWWNITLEVTPFMRPRRWEFGWHVSQNGSSYQMGPVAVYWWF